MTQQMSGKQRCISIGRGIKVDVRKDSEEAADCPDFRKKRCCLSRAHGTINEGVSLLLLTVCVYRKHCLAKQMH